MGTVYYLVCTGALTMYPVQAPNNCLALKSVYNYDT